MEAHVESRNSIQILVVDDDEGHAELVRRNLRRVGFSNAVTVLTDSETALDFVFCRSNHAHRNPTAQLVILLDINMPGINGVEVLRRIKADPIKKKIPVIMLTTTEDPWEINRCYEMGCSIYVKKPVEAAAFIDAISKLGMFIAVVNIPVEGERESFSLAEGFSNI